MLRRSLAFFCLSLRLRVAAFSDDGGLAGPFVHISVVRLRSSRRRKMALRVCGARTTASARAPDRSSKGFFGEACATWTAIKPGCAGPPSVLASSGGAALDEIRGTRPRRVAKIGAMLLTHAAASRPFRGWGRVIKTGGVKSFLPHLSGHDPPYARHGANVDALESCFEADHQGRAAHALRPGKAALGPDGAGATSLVLPSTHRGLPGHHGCFLDGHHDRGGLLCHPRGLQCDVVGLLGPHVPHQRPGPQVKSAWNSSFRFL